MPSAEAPGPAVAPATVSQAPPLTGDVPSAVSPTAAARQSAPTRFRGPAAALMLAGAAVGLVAFGGDLLGLGGSPGIGRLQMMLGLAGGVVAVQGLSLRSAPDELLAHWRTLSRSIASAGARRFAVITVQLLLFVVAARLLQIESPAFYQQIVPLAGFGFVVHHLLPQRQRLLFFAALSLGGLVVVAGLENAAWIAGLALGLIGICHLPVRFALRVGGLVSAGVLLALVRSGVIEAPWSAAVWPMLASLVMFRLVVYLYDLRHAAEKPSPSWSLAYFFLLPNAVFPLFPVVDFASFRRTYYDRDPLLIYQRGIDWIVRGTTHLLLYRVVYQHFTIAPENVTTLGQLAQYLVTTFLLYLKVSGQFHLIVGLLHLFGFRLPETNHLYYLASSFSDAWRRINIYWRDFMTKVVFYPTYLRLKGRGERLALVAATGVVFVVTWFAHAYQWYWLLGSWLLAPTDVLFWAVLGALLAVNSVMEAKRGRTRILGRWSGSARETLGLALRTTLTFLTIALLWSLWNSPTLGDWFNLLSVRVTGVGDFALIGAVFLVVGGAAVLAARRGNSVGAGERALSAAAVPAARPWRSVAGLATLCVLGLPGVGLLFSPETERLMRALRAAELSTRDVALMERGYYENLNGVAVRNSELWELYAQRAASGANIWSTEIVRQRADFLATELRPLHTEYQPGITFSTNRWGMRDREYEQTPPSDAYRIALLGQSHVAGDGVSDGQTFEWLVEDQLNDEHGPRTGRSYEILNFAIGSYSIEQQLLILDRVFSFEPNALYFVATPGDADRAVLHLVTQLRRGVRPPFPFLENMLATAGVTADMPESEALQRLALYREEVLRWGLGELAAACAARGVRAVWIYLYLPEPGVDPARVTQLEALARSLGFTTLNLHDVYPEDDLTSLWTSPWDHHPNAQAHRMIAERLYRELTTRPDLGVPLDATPSGAPSGRR